MCAGITTSVHNAWCHAVQCTVLCTVLYRYNTNTGADAGTALWFDFILIWFNVTERNSIQYLLQVLNISGTGIIKYRYYSTGTVTHTVLL